uniref:Uncharacterized protein n=1 Tax=Arundo donax TaxID=35708 RepID=A0A0A9A5J6_ARUDO
MCWISRNSDVVASVLMSTARVLAKTCVEFNTLHWIRLAVAPYQILHNGLLSCKYPSLNIVLCRIPPICSQAYLLHRAGSHNPAQPVYPSLE